MSAAKGKAKRPLGPRKMLQMVANRASARIVKRRAGQGDAAHSSLVPEFDDAADWVNVGGQAVLSQEVRRRYPR